MGFALFVLTRDDKLSVRPRNNVREWTTLPNKNIVKHTVVTMVFNVKAVQGRSRSDHLLHLLRPELPKREISAAPKIEVTWLPSGQLFALSCKMPVILAADEKSLLSSQRRKGR